MDKKGVSEMIGYILLITFAVVIASAVYLWLRSYVPREGTACPDDVSVYVSSHSYNAGSKILSLVISNNGKFAINGFNIYYSNDSKKEIATYDLTKFVLAPEISSKGQIFLSNTFNPQTSYVLSFDLANISSQDISFIEITPIRAETTDAKTQNIICSKAKTKYNMNLDLETDYGLKESEICNGGYKQCAEIKDFNECLTPCSYDLGICKSETSQSFNCQEYQNIHGFCPSICI